MPAFLGSPMGITMNVDNGPCRKVSEPFYLPIDSNKIREIKDWSDYHNLNVLFL
jgi:hypothetical protein